MVEDDWPLQVLQTRISPKNFKFRFSQDMVKDDWPLQVLQTRISPKSFKLIYRFRHAWCYSFPCTRDTYLFHGERWLTPQLLQSGISPTLFKFRFSLDMVDRWLTLCRYCRPESHLHFLSSDLARTWWKMIDPGRYCSLESHLKLFKVQT